MRLANLVGKCIALACIGALAACSGDGTSEVSSDELQVVFPNGTMGPFELGRVSVHVQCTGAPNDYFGEDPRDGADFWTDLEFENDGQDGMEVWHAFMDLLGDCLFEVFAYEPDGELFCTGQGATNVQPGDNDKVAVVLNCDVSQNIDTGMVDFDATPVLAVGNFCPLFHSLELIPDDIPITPPPLQIPNPNLPNDQSTELTVCMFDTADLNPDPANFLMSSCGSRCDVTPDPMRVTVSCKAEQLDQIGGNVIGPSTGTFSDPTNGGAGQDFDGDPTTYNGLCLGGAGAPLGLLDSIGYFSCDVVNEPGVAIRITCCGDDGDEDCEKCKTHDVQCSGQNLCAGQPPCDDDPNDCTDGGTCNPVNGVCEGAGDQPDGTPCDLNGNLDGICNGGECVLCSNDAECDDSNECTIDSCDPNTGCSNIVDEGALCSNGEGTCLADGTCDVPTPDPDPTQKLIPTVCRNSFNQVLSDIPTDVTVDPTPIDGGQGFTVDIDTTLFFTQDFLQAALIALFPSALTEADVTATQAAIATTGVAGAPVINTTTLTPLPQTLQIQQVPNPGDPGGQACSVDADCPFNAFGQTCGVNVAGQCDCACSGGCTPASCANVVTADLPVQLDPIVAAAFTADASGDVCFDMNGTIPANTNAANPIGPQNTGSRILAFGVLPVALDCGPGTVDPQDETAVIPNGPAEQICFPISP